MQDLINKAKSYLNGDLSYTEGISVFIQLTRNKQLIKFLTGPYSVAREQKLKYELSKFTKHNEKSTKITVQSRSSEPDPIIENQHKPVQKTPTKTEHNPVRSNPNHHYPGDSFSVSVVGRIEAERKEKYRERGHQHGRLHEAISDESRKGIALQILDVQSEIDQLNRELKEAKQGNIPPRFAKKSLSAEQYIKIRNLKQYIARYKKQIEQAETVQRRKQLEELLRKNEDELNRIL